MPGNQLTPADYRQIIHKVRHFDDDRVPFPACMSSVVRESARGPDRGPTGPSWRTCSRKACGRR